jgi:hypothetical protein
MMRLPFGQLIDDLLLFLPVGGKPENICSLRWLRADASPTKGPGHIARPFFKLAPMRPVHPMWSDGDATRSRQSSTGQIRRCL